MANNTHTHLKNGVPGAFFFRITTSLSTEITLHMREGEREGKREREGEREG